MKGLREPSFVSCPGADLARPVWGWGQDLEGVKVSVPGNLAFPHKETGVMGPKVAMCLICNAVETSCVPFVQHLLISLLLASSHGVTVSADSALFLPQKYSYSLISLLGRKDSLCKTSQPQLSCLLYFLVSWPNPT